MNYYRWKAVSGNEGNVYAFNKKEAIAKVETLFDFEVEEMELLEENVSRDRIRSRIQLKKGDKLQRIGDGKSFTYSSESDDVGYFYVEEMCVAVKLSDFEKEEE